MTKYEMSKTGHLRRKTVLGLVKQALKSLFAFNFGGGGGGFVFGFEQRYNGFFENFDSVV